MTIIERLNSGELHARARADRPDCVCDKGNIHATPERATFVRWLHKMQEIYGDSVAEWPQIARDEYRAKYVPSH